MLHIDDKSRLDKTMVFIIGGLFTDSLEDLKTRIQKILETIYCKEELKYITNKVRILNDTEHRIEKERLQIVLDLIREKQGS